MANARGVPLKDANRITGRAPALVEARFYDEIADVLLSRRAGGR